MSYQLLPFKQSPNYTPAGQTAAFYGVQPSRNQGAGHWWDAPERFPSFAGVVATLMNPARQASAHDVVGDGVVQPLVRKADTSWCTGSANPYTYSIETDPQIIYRWRAGGDKAKANRIFETLCERIADVSMHDKVWRPHKYWQPSTVCNPIEWAEVMQRAKQIWSSKYGQPAAPAVKEVGREVYNPVKKFKVVRECILEYIPNGGKASEKIFKNGEIIDIKQKLTMSDGSIWYRTAYSSENEINTGFRDMNIDEVVEQAEWQRNLKTITPVKLMVLTTQTPVVDLNSGVVIKQLGQGTWIDFTKSTTVGGIEYLISSYSATQAIPNGIKRADVGVPAEPPVNEKPEWLEKWQDIVDVPMYARADTDLVNFEDGSTIKVISRGTKLDISSTTEWHGHKYAITVYSTDKKFWQGVRIDDLDMKPVDADGGDVEPAPTQPTIEENVNWLVKAVKAILAFFKINV